MAKLIATSLAMASLCFGVEAGGHVAASNAEPIIAHFLHDLNISALARKLPLGSDLAQKKFSATHYRLIPFSYPSPIKYHFDGLAAVLKFTFDGQSLTISGQPYASNMFKHFGRCIVFNSGTGPTVGISPCVTNPVVNLLPINNQLWLTIDTAWWGRIDPVTLDTVPGAAPVISDSTILNAHPACDKKTNECFVQHPCGGKASFTTDEVCFSKLITSPGPTDVNLHTQEQGRTTMKTKKLMQHSHSPCITPNFVVSKLDAFAKNFDNDTSDAGILRQVHQAESNEWLVMDRRTNKTVVQYSNFSFVNNHFWNCYEDAQGNVIADTVAATSNYLYSYFEDRLSQATNWSKMFYRSMRCVVPAGTGDAANVTCTPLFLDTPDLYWDYPTFNPKFKMNPEYRYFYGVAASAYASRWFDRVIKVDAQARTVVAHWESPGMFVTEASFVPTEGTEEEDGVLVSVAYNSTAGRSNFLVFDPATLGLIQSFDLGDNIVPFHAHGVSCTPSDGCFTNP